MLKLFIHSFGYRFHFRFKPGFDIFALIDKAAALGFSGLNCSAFPPDFNYLGGAGADHVRAVRERLEATRMLIDIECNGTGVDHLTSQIDLAARLGAQHLRTYTRPAPGGARQQVEDAVRDLKIVAPVAERAGVRVLVENHEDLAATEVAEILQRVGHPSVGALFDYGNSMVFMKKPLDSLAHLRPWIRTAHMKDHVVVPAGAAGNAAPVYLGVPMGDGFLPVIETTRQIIAAGADRICFENCWAYQTNFRDRRGDGVLGEGAFGYRHPPYDPTSTLPNMPYKPGPGEPTIEDFARTNNLDLMAFETEAVRRSVLWLKTEYAKAGINLARDLNEAAA